ncbi:MAG TPA: PEP/pyruvate-binding domain-containing protein, partial [Symbiobacteriaceae bacterium]|nr:PEP/pyruvate-binding domain-containing protein [Symbiobacteriaceae bacterium]
MIDFAAAALAGAGAAGGKGWNLGRLWRYGFRVPRGGVVPADRYRALMETPQLSRLAAALSTVTAEQVTEPAVAAQLETLRSAIAAFPVDDGTLTRWLAESGLDRVPVAVRSSATLEDGESASFAGIHESYLSQLGPAAIERAVKGCYASLWTPRAVAYRRRLGI